MKPWLETWLTEIDQDGRYYIVADTGTEDDRQELQAAERFDGRRDAEAARLAAAAPEMVRVLLQL